MKNYDKYLKELDDVIKYFKEYNIKYEICENRSGVIFFKNGALSIMRNEDTKLRYNLEIGKSQWLILELSSVIKIIDTVIRLEND